MFKRLTIALTVLGTLVAWSAASPQAVATTSDETRSCGWALVGSSTQVNALYPDEAATYWVTLLPIPAGGHIEVKGEFPHARYTSLTTFTSQQQSIDGINDTQIVPDPGSTNPFLPGADRRAVKRSYTLRVVSAQVPASGRAPNTVYTTSADGKRTGGPLQRLSLRIYEGDLGQGIKGGVPLPKLTFVTSSGLRLPVPQCPDLMLPDLGLNSLIANAGTADPLPLDLTGKAENPPVFRKFTGTFQALLGDNALTDQLGEGGFGDNPDNKYVFSHFSPSHGAVLALRGKAPTYVPTFHGEPFMATGKDMRYWSFCTNAMTTQVFACRNDDRVVVDEDGYYTIVISTSAARPQNAVEACGVSWLPAGPLPSSVLILRNMLPSPTFAHAVQNTTPGTEEAVMGDYYPRGTYYPTTADFENLGCPAG